MWVVHVLVDFHEQTGFKPGQCQEEVGKDDAREPLDLEGLSPYSASLQ